MNFRIYLVCIVMLFSYANLSMAIGELAEKTSKISRTKGPCFRQFQLRHGIKYALDLANDRQENGRQFWMLLKNDAFFGFWLRYRTVDYMAQTPLDTLLSDYQALPKRNKKPLARTIRLDNFGQYKTVLCCSAQSATDMSLFSGLESTRRITEYELNVLSLKQGDTVIADDMAYLLGEFLGFANDAHIFALEEDSEKVIRIPAVSAAISRDPKLSGIEKIRLARSALRSYVQLSTSITIPKADIQYASFNDYFVISSRVHGTLTGHEFLTKLLLTNSEDENTHVFLTHALKSSSRDQTRKITGLLKLDEHALGNKGRALIPKKLESEGTATADWPEEFSRDVKVLRRLIWDEKLEQWILVDWDKFEAYLLGSAVSP